MLSYTNKLSYSNKL
ncbi:hypothetical protein YPPY66_4576, partial [Yersinia pestis PY-66]